MGLLFDFEEGDMIMTFSESMGINSKGDMMMKTSDNMAINMDTGDLHFTSSWGNNRFANSWDDDDDDWGF